MLLCIPTISYHSRPRSLTICLQHSPRRERPRFLFFLDLSHITTDGSGCRTVSMQVLSLGLPRTGTRRWKWSSDILDTMTSTVICTWWINLTAAISGKRLQVQSSMSKVSRVDEEHTTYYSVIAVLCSFALPSPPFFWLKSY